MPPPSGAGRPDLQVEPVGAMRPASPGMASPSLTSPTGSLISTPYVVPEPGYIAAKEAAFIITREVLMEFHSADEADLAQMQESSLSQISPSAISSVNAFLDRILLNILSNARSLSLVSLRPAVRDVLRPKLAQEAIAGADEELIECIGEDDDVDLFEDAQETQDATWDLDLAWKRARLRCMVYTRLGDMEEEDEDRYIEENGLDSVSDGRRLSTTGSMVSPPVAIWLTAILEYIGENVLMVATQAGYRRCEHKYGRGIAGQALHPSVLLVSDNDLEKIALNPMLGRLWRAWRKPIRSPKTSISRALSIDSMRHRRADSRASNHGQAREQTANNEEMTPTTAAAAAEQTPSSTTAEAVTPSEGEQKDREAARTTTEETDAEVDPANIALPENEHDVREIEIPWFNAAAGKASRPTSILIPDNETFSGGNLRDATIKEETSQNDQKEAAGEDDEESSTIKTLRRMRSGSLPTTPSAKWDYTLLAPIMFATNKNRREAAVTSGDQLAANGEMSGTMTDPTEFQAPAEVPPKSEKRLSSISQRRRSKRLSAQYSNTDRKSQASDVSESNGPALFSRSDYRVEQHEREVPRDINTDAPPFASNVVAPTPIAEHIPIPEKSDRRKNRLSTAGGDQYSSRRQSGEVSPLEQSEDEGSVSIAGLSDAQRHFSLPKQQQQQEEASRVKKRPVSISRPVSPINQYGGEEHQPVSPMSPEDEKVWPHIQSGEVSPLEKRKSVLPPPPTNTAPPTASVPAVASVPTSAPPQTVVIPAQLPESLQIGSRTPGSAPLQSASSGAVLSPPAGRSAHPMGRQESEERRREGVVMPQSFAPPTGAVNKEMPDLPKDAQLDILAAASMAHANVAVPTPDKLFQEISKPDTEYPPRAPPKDATSQAPPPPQPRQYPGKQRDTPVYSAVDSEPMITSVTPAPGGPAANARRSSPDSAMAQMSPPPIPSSGGGTTVTIHRKELSQDSRGSQGPSPLQLGSGGSGPASPESGPSKLLQRRQQPPPVSTDGIPGATVTTPERAAVQKLPSPTSATDVSSKQFPARVVSESVQQGSNMNAVGGGIPGGSSVVKRKPASRTQSKSGDEAFGDNHFDQLIDSGETMKYTLTPHHLRNEKPDQWSQDTLVSKSQSMDRNRSNSGSNGLAATSSPSTKPRSSSKTVGSRLAGFPVKIPFGAIRTNSHPNNITTRGGLVPRDAKAVSGSTAEMAAFISTTSPTGETGGSSSNALTPAGGRPPAGSKRSPQPVLSENIGVKPATISLPPGSLSTGARRPVGKLVARDAQASGGSNFSDLINLLNEDPPGTTRAPAPPNGVPRNMGGPSYGGSINSTQESFKTQSGISSTNSHTGLLSNSGRSNGGGGGIPHNSYGKHSSQEEPMMPVRKSRRPRDPYAIDDDDDDLDVLGEEDESEGGGGNEESLADFLNSQGRIDGRGAGGGGGGNAGLNNHPPPRVSSQPQYQQQSSQPPMNPLGGNAVGGAGGPVPRKVSSIGRPVGPGGIPSAKSLRPSGGGSDMMDLANFLSSSGPPPGTISRAPAPQEEEGGKRGIGKVFGGRNKTRA